MLSTAFLNCSAIIVHIKRFDMEKALNNVYLAEIAGIHAGDGYMRFEGRRKEIDISGAVEEREYYDLHVIPLFKKCFCINIIGRDYPSRGTYGFRTSEKCAIEALSSLGFPSGNKTLIVKVPEIILRSKDYEILTAFLRGYFDTDGSITFDKKIYNSSPFMKKYNYYPRIMFTTTSKYLAYGVQEITRKLGFNCKIYTHKPKKDTESLKYKLQITGVEQCEKWMRQIGSKNQSKLSRYLIWKKFGFCPPKTTYVQRISILNRQSDPKSYYGPVV